MWFWRGGKSTVKKPSGACGEAQHVFMLQLTGVHQRLSETKETSIIYVQAGKMATQSDNLRGSSSVILMSAGGR